MTKPETKQEVFDELLDAYDDAVSVGSNLHPTDTLLEYDARYDAALPDDLPVLPKAVGEYIERSKDGLELLPTSLFYVFNLIGNHINSDKAHDIEVENWIIDNSDIFARAWLLEAWIVEETGEVVRV